MSSSQENFKNQLPAGLDNIEELDFFKNSLEKYFFSQVNIRDYSTDNTTARLVLELDCNFGITEMLHHLNLGTWGGFGNEEVCFKNLIKRLRECNDIYIEIEEFSIFLKDTSIIISKIYQESIVEQLESILQSIKDNYVRFTKGLTEAPYEIYVPIFEEGLLDQNSTLMNIKSGNNDAKDYFKYWGLYFYTEDDAVIYDLKNGSIIPGDIKMLNL